MRRHDVGIALDHHRLALLAYRGAREFETVQHVRFLVQQRFRGVDVLRRHAVVVEDPACPKTHDLAPGIPDRPDCPSLEEVPARLSSETSRDQLWVAITAATKMAQQRAAVLRSKTDLKPLRRFTIEAALSEELPGCQGVRAAELIKVELCGQPESLSKSGARTRFEPRPGFVGVAQLDPNSVCQTLDGLDEAQIVDLAHEVDHVATLGAGAEAIPVAARGGDLETRGLLVVEGTQALHRAACAAKGDVRGDYFLDARPIAYGGDVFFVDPAAHGPESMLRP